MIFITPYKYYRYEARIYINAAIARVMGSRVDFEASEFRLARRVKSHEDREGERREEEGRSDNSDRRHREPPGRSLRSHEVDMPVEKKKTKYLFQPDKSTRYRLLPAVHYRIIIIDPPFDDFYGDDRS